MLVVVKNSQNKVNMPNHGFHSELIAENITFSITKGVILLLFDYHAVSLIVWALVTFFYPINNLQELCKR